MSILKSAEEEIKKAPLATISAAVSAILAIITFLVASHQSGAPMLPLMTSSSSTVTGDFK